MSIDIYCLNDTDQTNWKTSSKVPNIAVRTSWQYCNKAVGQYNFSIIDKAITAVTSTNGQIHVVIPTGKRAPSWILNQVQTISSQGTVYPVPWDTTYQDYYLTFIKELGAQFSGNPAISAISCNLFNVDTGEIALYKIGDPSGSLTLADWQKVGYTPSNAEQSFEYSCESMQACVSGIPIYSMWFTKDKGLGFDSTNGASTIASMMKFYNNLNPALTCNGNAGANPTYLMPFPSTLPIIYQEGSSNGYGNGVNTIISNCNRSTNDILSLEIYQSDVDHVS